MLGFFCGALFAVALYKISRHGFGRGRCGGRSRRGGRHRMMLNWLFRRLDTTHGQEKVVKEASVEVEAALRDARDQFGASLQSLARALRSDEFGHEQVADAWVRQDDAVEKTRLALTTAMQSLHGTLERDQRHTLADMVERGACGAY